MGWVNFGPEQSTTYFHVEGKPTKTVVTARLTVVGLGDAHKGSHFSLSIRTKPVLKI